MAFTLLVANIFGFITGEWTGAPTRSLKNSLRWPFGSRCRHRGARHRQFNDRVLETFRKVGLRHAIQFARQNGIESIPAQLRSIVARRQFSIPSMKRRRSQRSMLRSIAASTISMLRRPTEARGRRRFSAKLCAASRATDISSPRKLANTPTQTIMATTPWTIRGRAFGLRSMKARLGWALSISTSSTSTTSNTRIENTPSGL